MFCLISSPRTLSESSFAITLNFSDQISLPNHISFENHLSFPFPFTGLWPSNHPASFSSFSIYNPSYKTNYVTNRNSRFVTSLCLNPAFRPMRKDKPRALAFCALQRHRTRLHPCLPLQRVLRYDHPPAFSSPSGPLPSCSPLALCHNPSPWNSRMQLPPPVAPPDFTQRERSECTISSGYSAD